MSRDRDNKGRFIPGHSINAGKKYFSKESHPRWKGGVTLQDGYVLIRVENHPKIKSRYIMEHRLVMEKQLGRYLERWEQVHHKNGIKNDNRVENLQLIYHKKHYGEIKCPHCLKLFLIR